MHLEGNVNVTLLQELIMLKFQLSKWEVRWMAGHPNFENKGPNPIESKQVEVKVEEMP